MVTCCLGRLVQGLDPYSIELYVGQGDGYVHERQHKKDELIAFSPLPALKGRWGRRWVMKSDVH